MPMSSHLRGLIAMAVACTIWGLSGLYYKLLEDVPPLEVLSHRTIWSLLTIGGLLVLRRQGRLVISCLNSPAKLGLTVVTALLIGTNWLGFIYAIQTDQALEASLGYYIMPLITVLLGRVIYKDMLRPLQWVAVAMAALAVTQLTIGLGVLPKLSLVMATTFSLYGALKRRLSEDATASVAAESAVLAPIGLVWLCGVHWAGWTGPTDQAGAFFGDDLGISLLLVASGPITGVPLLLFSYAAQRVALPTIGLVQYLNPTLQFLMATLVFGEIFTFYHAICFALIWAGLGLYTFDGLRGRRTHQRAAVPRDL